jgi:hypothetical protein
MYEGLDRANNRLNANASWQRLYYRNKPEPVESRQVKRRTKRKVMKMVAAATKAIRIKNRRKKNVQEVKN